MTRDAVRERVTDEQAVIATLYGEARNEPIEAVIAVACVIRNRVKADLGGDGKRDWWGEGYQGVCLQPWQFSCWWETNTNSAKVYEVAEALIDGRLPTEPSLIAELAWIAEGVMTERVRDLTDGSTHYITEALWRKAAPKWARGLAPVASIGAHVFFNNVR